MRSGQAYQAEELAPDKNENKYISNNYKSVLSKT